MDDAIDVVESRTPEGFGFLVKVRASGQVYRVAPARDPRQPRFWCVLVTRCTSGGMADPSERPWIGAGGMTREELPTALAAIRADVGAWLAQESCRELHRWLLTPSAVSPAVAAATSARGGGRDKSPIAQPKAILGDGAQAGGAQGAR